MFTKRPVLHVQFLLRFSSSGATSTVDELCMFWVYVRAPVAKPARQFGHAMQIFPCSYTVKTINL